MKKLYLILCFCASVISASLAAKPQIETDIVIAFNSRNCHNCIIYDAGLIRKHNYVNYTFVARKSDSTYLRKVLKAYRLNAPTLFNDSIFKAINVKEAPETMVAYQGEGKIWKIQPLHRFYEKDFPEKYTLPMILNKKPGKKICNWGIEEFMSYKGITNKHIWLLGHNPAYITKIDLSTNEKTVIEKPIPDADYLTYLKIFLGEAKAMEVYPNRGILDSAAFDYFQVDDLQIVNDNELILDMRINYCVATDTSNNIMPYGAFFKYNVSNKEITLLKPGTNSDTLGFKVGSMIPNKAPSDVIVQQIRTKSYRNKANNPMFGLLKQKNGSLKLEISKAKYLKIHEIFTTGKMNYDDEILVGNFCFYKRLNQFVNIQTGEWCKLPFKQKNGKKEIYDSNVDSKHYIFKAMEIGEDIFLLYRLEEKSFAAIVSPEGKILVNQELSKNDFKLVSPLTTKYGIARNPDNLEEMYLCELE